MYSRLLTIFVVAILPSALSAEQKAPQIPESVPNLVAVEESAPEAPVVAEKMSKEIDPFTGKITGNKVRLRLAPTLDGTILSELSKNDLVVVTGEIDEFYTIKPFPESKAYIYRAYVLDGVVEANNVNIRLEPNNHSPVLTQLNQGDRVSGTLCPNDNKWLEIDLPEAIRFYVSKVYVTNAGDESIYHKTANRRQQVGEKLTLLQQSLDEEMKKTFRAIQLMPLVTELKTIAAQNQDLPELAEKAQTMIKTAQEEYLALSQRKSNANQESSPQCSQTAEDNKEGDSEQTVHTEQSAFRRFASFSLEKQEISLVDQAISDGKAATREEFYLKECSRAEEKVGQLIPYERLSSTRPGDFMLVDSKTKVPVAYLYSSNVDLNQFIGRNIRVVVSPRPDHHYALPAFFVHEVKGM